MTDVNPFYVLSEEDKAKFDGIEAGAQINPEIATELQAQQGVDNTNMMTPLATSQAIAQLQAVKSVNSKVGEVALTKTDVGLANVTNDAQAKKEDLDAHVANTSNPHMVTKEQVGLGNLTNLNQAGKTEFNNHVANTSNPHAVTATQVGAYTKAESDSSYAKKTDVVDLGSTQSITGAKNFSNITINNVSLLNLIYPIGTVYTNTSTTNPSTTLGGTWERFGQGQVLVGVKDGDATFGTAGSTGGSTTHMHTLTGAYAQLQLTGSTLAGIFKTVATYTAVNKAQNFTAVADSSTLSYGTQVAGNTDSSSNMPPYVTVYMWKRTA